MNIDGSQPRQLTDFKADLIWSFDWSRGDHIVMARGRKVEDIVMVRSSSAALPTR